MTIRRHAVQRAASSLLTGLVVVLASCGGGSTNTGTPTAPPPSVAYTLTVSTSTSGSGSVSSSPTGINCGSTCQASFASGTAVTLTATVASGNTFSAWGGACLGSSPTCTVSMNQTQSVSASFSTTSTTAMTVTGTTANNPPLCTGLINQGQFVHGMIPRPQPALGHSYTAQYGATITRISDVAAMNNGADGAIVPMYSTVPAWNADESYILLYQTAAYSTSGIPSHYLLYNGKPPYGFIKVLDFGNSGSAPADVEDAYWSPTQPDILYYITDYGVPNGNFGPVLVQYNVTTDTVIVLHVFSTPSGASPAQVDFGHILYGSWANTGNNLIVGVRWQGTYPNAWSTSYNITTGKEGQWVYDTTGYYSGLQTAPSGNVGMIDGKVVMPTTQVALRTIQTDPSEHGDLALLANGDDAWVSSQYGSSAYPSVPFGNIIVEDLETGEVTTVVGQANGWGYPGVTSHISALAFQAPGWVANSIVGTPNGNGLLDQMLLLANINTGQVCELGHHHSNGSDPSNGGGPRGYWAEPHVVISPTGTRILFGSDWNGGPTVDTYVLTLPSYKP